jgi:hypothetical protein
VTASDPDDPDHPGATSEREEALRLYEIAVEEYRFQVLLNWDRAKYLLGFNVAVIGVGAGLVRVGGAAGALLATVFVVGFMASVLSMVAVRLQHGYYRRSRDVMVAQAAALGLAERSVSTTPGARGARTTWWLQVGKVQNVLYVLLVTCAVIDVYGVLYLLLV